LFPTFWSLVSELASRVWSTEVLRKPTLVITSSSPSLVKGFSLKFTTRFTNSGLWPEKMRSCCWAVVNFSEAPGLAAKTGNLILFLRSSSFLQGIVFLRSSCCLPGRVIHVTGPVVSDLSSRKKDSLLETIMSPKAGALKRILSTTCQRVSGVKITAIKIREDLPAHSAELLLRPFLLGNSHLLG
jgi:hypothetical protein